ncbi:hypothetical protein GCK72_002420 [Caenorhabditis remanei]|uniref:DRBM domain-containing protein n=1 Tax=Caenorhabditis remanei TaxID=31234 RepID=A0A6A5HTY6_CAERE|nr:hypothetical protein GCK72_002420 [Caenorhabditis remanei]KAF1770601.1 hypothetical protein GCK72_002420 [Caenorhabditis remanei]
MEPESGGVNQQLLAEREAILKQLALLGSGSEDEGDGDEEEAKEVKFEVKEVKVEVKEEDNIKVEIVETEVGYSEPVLFNSSPDSIQSSTALEEEEEIISDRETPIDCDEGEKREADSSNTSSENSRTPPVAVEKTVLDRVDFDKSYPLPDGWTRIAHYSGMPVYYHKFTQVVTHSRPYQVDGMVRDHEIPVSAIPCLYREVMDKKYEDLKNHRTEISENCDEKEKRCPIEIPPNESKMNPEQYRDYCARRFKFKKVTVHRYIDKEGKQSAAQKRRVNSMLKNKGFELDYDQLKQKNQPGEVLLTSASGACLIDLTPIQPNLSLKKGSGPKKPYLLNPMGKTSVAVLNEFVQRLAKGTLVYEVENTRNVSAPYKATALLTMKMSTIRDLAGQCKESLIVLSEIATASENVPAPGIADDFKRFEIGSGNGSNKKTARLVAAKDALSKLIPKLRMSEEYVCDGVLEQELQKDFETSSKVLLKQVKIDSSGLVEMCNRFGIPKPFALLKEVVARSMRWSGVEFKKEREMVGSGSQLSRVILSLGEMKSSAEAIGMKQANEIAAQRLFKQMHPDMESYGNLLKVYGHLVDKTPLENSKRQHDEVVRLQDTGNLLQPNLTVIAKLTEEMEKVTLIHPPRNFLYGLSPNATGVRTNKASMDTQTEILNYNFIPHMNPNPIMIPPPYFHVPPQMQPPMQPLLHMPMVHPPQFSAAPPPVQDYGIYQSPQYQSPQYQQRNARKRSRPDETLSPCSYSMHQKPPYN